MNRKKLFIVLGLLAIVAVLAVACTPATQEVIKTVIVTEVVEQAGQTVEVTKIVEVTPEPTEAMAVEFSKADPSTFVYTTFGDSETLDPALNYETSGGEIIQNVYEPLVYYNRQNATEFVPQLASDWTISDDGTTYTFNIREGVKFHQGGDLTASDVAYTFQRGILQGGGASPQWLLIEPVVGVGTADIAELVDPSGAFVDDPAGLQAADPAALQAACETITNAIVADDAAGTVTFTLAQAWGPFLGTIAQGWGGIQDKEWDIENGAWDGDCATWQNYYGKTPEDTPLQTVMNGTGPFMLESWTPNEETVLVRNDNYWRTEPIWDGGPSGTAAIERVVRKSVDEWGTRFAMFQAGDTDFVTVNREDTPQVDPLVGETCTYNADTLDFDCSASENNPDGPFRLFIGAPGVSRTDAMFVFDINTEGGNPLIGSGQLDGNGIPPDFFTDEHVRKAFNYCFDWSAFIDEVMLGEAVQNTGVLIPGMLGYDQNGSQYHYDLDMCKSEIEQAWDGQVAENGFRVQVAYNTGNTSRQAVAQILQNGFQAVDPKYQIEVVGLPWPTFLGNIRESRLPVYVSGWLEDIHDPHNWAQPFTVGTYASRQALPDDMVAGYKELVDAGVAATDPAERSAIYEQLQQMDYDNAIAIRLAVATGRHYEQRWVDGYYYNPVYPGFYYYALSNE
jgi:peptide/nickel transport system substrate-binding protein